jgi:hypothetical protein
MPNRPLSRGLGAAACRLRTDCAWRSGTVSIPSSGQRTTAGERADRFGRFVNDDATLGVRPCFERHQLASEAPGAGGTSTTSDWMDGADDKIRTRDRHLGKKRCWETSRKRTRRRQVVFRSRDRPTHPSDVPLARLATEFDRGAETSGVIKAIFEAM